MLSPADADIVERDTALSGLRLALDTGALMRQLSLPPLRAVYLRYKPGTSCVASLIPDDGGLGAVAVMAYPARRYEEVRARRNWHEKPQPVRFLDAENLAVVPLARDRGLKGMRRIADPERGPAFLSDLLQKGDPGPVRLLRYKAGRRAVLRVGGFAPALIKSYAEADFAAALEGARIGAELGAPWLAGLSERRHCIAWPWQKGQSLCPEAAGTGPPEAWQATGQALARIHHAPMRPKRHVRRADEVAEILASSAMLGWLRPDQAPRIAGLVARVRARLEESQFTPTLIHGDFSADQILFGPQEITVVDWDRASVGDPARDIGSFLARLDVQAIDGCLGAAEHRRAVADFTEGYGDGRANSPAILAQHARALLALLPEGFRQRRPDWPERAKRIIARIEELLKRPVIAPGCSVPDEQMPALGAALDVAVMRPLLSGILPQPVHGLDARLIRHKPGRRALIRYRITYDDRHDPEILLGKLRAKGLDARMPALHAALRAKGLGGEAPHRVGVPAARGVLSWPALWLQERVPGRKLTDLLPENGAPHAARLVGRALARLHMVGLPVARTWTAADELAVLERALCAARENMPGEAHCIEAILKAAAHILHELPAAETTGIHRDFYPDQVLIDGDRVWLLDLDLYAEGDPAVDLGNFLAHLDELGLRLHGNPQRFEREATAFLAGYESLRTVDHGRVELLRLVSLARHINLSRIIPGRAHITTRLIEHCVPLLVEAACRPERLAP